MEQRANGRAYHGHHRRSCDIDRLAVEDHRTLHSSQCPYSAPAHPCRRLNDSDPLRRRAVAAASALIRRPWFLGPLIVWGLASLLGCAGPVGFPALLPIKAALPGENRVFTPVLVSSLSVAATTAPTAEAPSATPAAQVTATPEAPVQAPEAGPRMAAAAPARRRAPQPLATLFLSLADAVKRDASAQVTAPGSGAPVAEAAAAIEANPPDRIRSAAIDLDIEIVPVGWKQVERDGKVVSMWEVGSYVASWHKTSAMPGQVGNMVITGHNNIEGSVFRRLPDLRVGDELVVEAAGRPYTYTVDTMFVVQEKGATPEQKRWNGQWIGNFEDERLTLITCYPPDGNSHRLIVIAKPAAS